MAFLVIRIKQTKKGLKWSLRSVEKRKERTVKEPAFSSLGFNKAMSVQQAKDQAAKLNKLNQIERKEQKTKQKASENLERLAIVKSSIVPEEMSILFVKYLKENSFGGDYSLKKSVVYWNKVQKIITDLRLPPNQFYERRKEVYKRYAKEKLSVSYLKKILSTMNLWGEFYSRETNSYFKKIPFPRGVILEHIRESARSTGAGAAPLSPNILKKLNGKLPEGQWEYLHCTLWFGLRPAELDAILENKEERLKIESQKGVRVIGVYQSKLTGIARDLRWKWIPVIHPEQKVALKNINLGKLQKPLIKTIRKHAPIDAGMLSLYSGRKGFTDLMLGFDQSIEDISQWLGHSNLDRTWKHYKSRKQVHFKKITNF